MSSIAAKPPVVVSTVYTRETRAVTLEDCLRSTIEGRPLPVDVCATVAVAELPSTCEEGLDRIVRR